MSSAAYNDIDLGDFRDNGHYLNYTHIKTLDGADFSMSPRMQFCGTVSDTFDNQPLCVMLMDTDREEKISLGPEYKYGPLKAGECIVPKSAVKDYGDGLNVGDEVQLQMELYPLSLTQSKYYNDIYDVKFKDRVVVDEFSGADYPIYCTIKHIWNDSYGKLSNN